MHHASNQALERHYFEQFRDHFALPAGDVEYTDRPDVIVRGDRKLGIEIASLYLVDGSDPKSEQAQRHRRDAVLNQARDLYLALGGKEMDLTVSFDPERPITNTKGVASALAGAAASIEKSPAGQVRRSLFAHIPEVFQVFHHPAEHDSAAWRATQGFAVPGLSLARVESVATAKQEKLAQYQPCDAYWLLLVVDFIDPAQDQEIQWPDQDPQFASAFEKIIIYKPQVAEWIEVPLDQARLRLG